VTARGPTDRGSATVFAASIALVLVMAATVAVLVVAVILASHRARAAADLAALAAATEIGGSDVCTAARASARTNGADLTSCVLTGTTSSFVVAVSVTVPTGLRNPLPMQVNAEAHAGNAVG